MTIENRLREEENKKYSLLLLEIVCTLFEEKRKGEQVFPELEIFPNLFVRDTNTFYGN